MKTTASDKRAWQAYERAQRKIADMASSRPILNPNGPTALIPARKRVSVVVGGQLQTRFAPESSPLPLVSIHDPRYPAMPHLANLP